MGLSRSERVVLCFLAISILVGRLVRDRLDRADTIVVLADSIAVVDSSGSVGRESLSVERSDPPSDGAPSEQKATEEGRARGALDLNLATEAELVTLPGIGPTKARAIAEWRAAHGPFGRVDDLLDVPGIGPKTAAQLRDLVVATAAPSAPGRDSTAGASR